MRGNSLGSNTARFVLLFFLQVFIFRQVTLGWSGKEYLFVWLYPLFIAALPLRIPRPAVVAVAFLAGLSVDIFYGTLGLHASAATATGYFRQFPLNFLEPKDGYKTKSSPEGRDLGQAWWMRYLAFIMTFYGVFYFSVEAFSPVFWQDIVLKSLLSIPVSYLLALILVSFLRPRL
jgi:hypothetical protein